MHVRVRWRHEKRVEKAHTKRFIKKTAFSFPHYSPLRRRWMALAYLIKVIKNVMISLLLKSHLAVNHIHQHFEIPRVFFSVAVSVQACRGATALNVHCSNRRGM